MSQLSGGDSITRHLHQIIILIELKKIKQNEWYSYQLQLFFVFRANKQMAPPKPNTLKKKDCEDINICYHSSMIASILKCACAEVQLHRATSVAVMLYHWWRELSVRRF